MGAAYKGTERLSFFIGGTLRTILELLLALEASDGPWGSSGGLYKLFLGAGKARKAKEGL